MDQSLGISYGFAAIAYGADHNIPILNLSWGSGAYSQYGQDVCNYAAINKGVLLVAAAGNTFNSNYVYPASYENVISVAASGVNDDIWDNGNGTGSTHNYLVDVTAPGKSIMTSTGPTGYWGGSTGTSMAAPLFCGAAAIVKAKFPALNYIQAGEVVRVTARDIYGRNPQLTDKIGLGIVDMYNALTTPVKKSVRVDTMFVDDNDNNIAEPFDTLELTGSYINFLDPTTNLELSLTAENPDMIEVIQGTDPIGAMGTLSATQSSVPFKVVVKGHVNKVTPVWLRIGMQDGDYSDFQYWRLDIHPNKLDVDQNDVVTSINSIGNFGFVDHPFNSIGKGLKFSSGSNLIQDGGLMVGISQINVVDVVANETGFRNDDFKSTTKPYGRVPGPLADHQTFASYTDAEAGANKIGLDIRQRTYQYTAANDKGYVIMEYVIKNTNNYPVNSAYAGISTEFSGSSYFLSAGNFYPDANAVAAKFDYQNISFYSGVSLLSEQNVNAKVESLGQYTRSKTEKFEALRNNPVGMTDKTGQVIEIISAGPFDIAPGDSEIVAFALLGANDYPTFEVMQMNAKSKYWCDIRQTRPSVDLGGDIQVCRDSEIPTLTAAAGGQGIKYQWSTGDTVASINPTSSGTITVTVSNEFGCEAMDTMTIENVGLHGFAISISVAEAKENDPVGFEIIDPNGSITSWNWDFGDGNTSNTSSPVHTYDEPGTYTVTAIIGNGLCSDTITYDITVSTIAGWIGADLAGIKLFPNPVTTTLRMKLEDDYQGPVQLRVFDNAGKMVREKKAGKEQFCD